MARQRQLQMLLFPNALCCSLYERNCVCAVTKTFTKFLPANNFCQLLRVTRKRSCTSAGNAQSQLHFRMINRGRLELATSPIARLGCEGICPLQKLENFVFLELESCNLLNTFRRKSIEQVMNKKKKHSFLGLTDPSFVFWKQILIKLARIIKTQPFLEQIC